VARGRGRQKRQTKGGSSSSTGAQEAAASDAAVAPRVQGRRRRLLFAALVAAAVIAAVLFVTRTRVAPLKREAGLDVLLITIDTLRADALGCYGNRAVETPWIDRLAAAGVRFERAHAQNVVTRARLFRPAPNPSPPS